MIQYRTIAGRFLLLAAALALVAGCAKKLETQGHIVDFEQIERIRPGIHDAQSVAAILGSPSNRAVFRENIWYFTTRKTAQSGVFDKETVDQHVIAVHFDEFGIVEEVKTINGDSSRDITFVERSTPTRGKELTLLEQLFGNIGRFNNTDQ